jgi:ornithine carbamoyltransferase
LHLTAAWYRYAKEFAAESGGSFKVEHDMKEAFKDADVVYPKSWAPFAVMKKRTELIRAGHAKVSGWRWLFPSLPPSHAHAHGSAALSLSLSGAHSLTHATQGPAMESLEKEALETNSKHKDWECTEEMMAVTKGGKAHYMHPLPADLTGVSCEEVGVLRLPRTVSLSLSLCVCVCVCVCVLESHVPKSS